MISSRLSKRTAAQIRPSLRLFATASDKVTMSTALKVFEAMIPKPPELTPSSPIPSQSPPPPSTSSGVQAMNIPPPEDPLLHYLTSKLLRHGHRARASRITSRTLLHIHTLMRAPPLPILREAILKASPAIRTMMHRQGAKNIARPIALGEKQRTRFAVEWILEASKKRAGQTIEERLAKELVAVFQGDSTALAKKSEVHRFAMVNRGNARSRV